METTQAIPDWRATADEIWAMLRETARRQEETDRIVKETAQQMKETDKRLEKQMRETDKQMKETDKQMKETDKRMKETDKRLGGLGNRFGDMIEYMIIPNLVGKFGDLGFTFTKANRTEIKDREHDLFTEVDALLENGDKVMAVEIKSKPKNDDIDDHVERMEKLRKYADLHSDKRIYFGAIAGVVFGEGEKIYALKNGFYVIEPSGDTFNITPPEGKYHPHEW
jgi:exonuclease VII large subunit